MSYVCRRFPELLSRDPILQGKLLRVSELVSVCICESKFVIVCYTHTYIRKGNKFKSTYSTVLVSYRPVFVVKTKLASKERT